MGSKEEASRRQLRVTAGESTAGQDCGSLEQAVADRVRYLQVDCNQEEDSGHSQMREAIASCEEELIQRAAEGRSCPVEESVVDALDEFVHWKGPSEDRWQTLE